MLLCLRFADFEVAELEQPIFPVDLQMFDLRSTDGQRLVEIVVEVEFDPIDDQQEFFRDLLLNEFDEEMIDERRSDRVRRYGVGVA